MTHGWPVNDGPGGSLAVEDHTPRDTMVEVSVTSRVGGCLEGYLEVPLRGGSYAAVNNCQPYM